MLFLLFIIFILLIIAPFILVFTELFHPQGLKYQFIDMNYIKDIQYFEKSFLKNLFRSLGTNPDSGIVEIELSKKELVEVSDSKIITPDQTISHVIYVKGDLETGPNVKFEKEIFVSGKVIFGENNLLRAVVSKNDLIFSKNTVLFRWAGSDKNIIVKENCDLGIKTSCEGKMEIGSGCKFKYIYAKPIITHEFPANTENSDLLKKKNQLKNKKEEIKNSSWFVDHKQMSIPSYTIVEKNLVISGNLYIYNGCFITGSIKTQGYIILDDYVTVNGDLYSDSNIFIGKNCVINGNIFTNKSISIDEGTQISRVYETKSIIGKKKVELSNNVIIYGYVLSENSGKIL